LRPSIFQIVPGRQHIDKPAAASKRSRRLFAGNAVSSASSQTGGGNISFSQRAARKFQRISGPRSSSLSRRKDAKQVFIDRFRPAQVSFVPMQMKDAKRI
jgi:hypothetical protein